MQYHEKIIKSYIVDSLNGNSNINNINKKEITEILKNISESVFTKSDTTGLGESIKFSNDYGSGLVLIYDDEMIHMPYFKDL